MKPAQSTLLVINPNSTQVVTDHISLALEVFRRPDGPAILCETLTSGPPGIESQAHVDGISEKLIAWFEAHPHYRNVDAVVLACFSDPGMVALRETISVPVFGSAECAYLTAAAMGDKLQWAIRQDFGAHLGGRKRLHAVSEFHKAKETV